jgi:hypothetical protein
MLRTCVEDPSLRPGEAYMISVVKVKNLVPPQPDAVSPAPAERCGECEGTGRCHMHTECDERCNFCRGSGAAGGGG